MLRGETSFMDAERWNELAKEAGIRLPQWRTPCTTGKMKWYLTKIGVSLNKYLTYWNEPSLKKFVQMNPDWPLRAWLGIELEILNWEKEQKCLTPSLPSGQASQPRSRRATTKTSSLTLESPASP